MHQLVNLASANPNIKLDIRYATALNFLGFPFYTQAVCYVHQEVAEALNLIQNELEPLQLSLKVFDGYRPLHIQQMLWNRVQNEKYVSNPEKFKGGHTRGMAVDLTLIDVKGNELEMPSEFDEFNEKAHSDYPHASPKAKQHRELLKSIMEKHGFKNYFFEWWHFDLQGWNDDSKYPSLDLSFEELHFGQ